MSETDNWGCYSYDSKGNPYIFGEGFSTELNNSANHFEIKVKLPRVKKQDIEISYYLNELFICAKIDENEVYAQNFKLECIEPSQISAEFKKELLKINIPKNKRKEKQIFIEIK